MCRKLARLLRPHNDIHMSYSYYTVVYEMAVFSQCSINLHEISAFDHNKCAQRA